MAKKQVTTEEPIFQGDENSLYVQADPTSISDDEYVYVKFITPSVHDATTGISTKQGEDVVTRITGAAWNIYSNYGERDTIKDPSTLAAVVFLGLSK